MKNRRKPKPLSFADHLGDLPAMLTDPVPFGVARPLRSDVKLSDLLTAGDITEVTPMESDRTT
ncbi:hypothetical protein ACQKOH_21355 [Sphingomonas sp. NPDC092331]|jgi:hypothetical protein|uniref:Uncharacterized protein n=4 Tax=Sphingomonadaceae TaxID=41297 RepID=T0HSK2_9SPHN|nr:MULTISPECIES: hypothetical protein [Sphingomonadaceae]MBN8841648.1 hypothetical protein [Sphingomonadales bacterium]PZU71694.1 MAG: hypothetical protein DI546_15355 [Rhizobium sp.]ALR23055.1 hypothetical protein ATN00_21395 [Sphingobium baderi]EQB16067.1 hypothetical protein L284_10165 [Novosphingobium lindaniclasticum LE124]KQO55152.1 hypothetical protein ASF14_19645 [Sphingomonas sp. Leaf257]